jgi:hypothetical protein
MAYLVNAEYGDGSIGGQSESKLFAYVQVKDTPFGGRANTTILLHNGKVARFQRHH